jgi:hypothetical protein
MPYELHQLKRMADSAADMTSEARELSERDRDYYDSYQWTAEEQATLKRRKQPIVTIPRIKRKVDAMVGIEQRGRVDPVAYPRNPGDEESADLATKALRFVEETQRLDVIRSRCFENLLVEGYGGVEVCVEETRGGLDPSIKQLRWEEIFYDPHSREKDFSDAAYVGVIKWMSHAQATTYARRYWQGDEEALADMLDVNNAGESGETYEDRPLRESGRSWIDKRLKRVRFAQMYYLYGEEWRLAIFTGRGVLYDEPSPYLDEDQKPSCAIYLMSGYVDRENRRYGVVRDMISAQDEINKRRSKLLHLLNTRQTVAVKGVIDAAEVKRQLSMPDGHIELNPEAFEDGVRPFEIIPTNDMTAGQALLLQEAKQEIDLVGPNASLLGQAQGQQSGRAIMAQQQAGLAELAPVYDSLRDWTERVYRAVWMRIRQFWTEPRWIRVTEDTEAPQFLGLNQVQMGPYGPEVVNNVAEIDVDITIDQAPDFATLRAEQFEKLADLAKSGFPIPPDVIIEASDLRDKKKLLEKMRGDPQKAQMQEQVQMQGIALEMQDKQNAADLKDAQAERARAAAMKDMASIPKVQAEAQQVAVETALRPREMAMRAMPQAI